MPRHIGISSDGVDYLPMPSARQAPGPSGAAFARGSAAIFILALLAGMVWLYWTPSAKLLWGDEATYLAAATRLLATGSAGLDLLWPPLYPCFLAGLLAIGGESLVAVQIVQIGLLIVSALLLRGLTTSLTGSRPAGLTAAFLLLADPTMAAFATYLWPEVLHVFLFLTVIWLLVHRSERPLWLGVAGFTLGLALLTKSLLGPFWPVLLVPLLVVRPRRRALGAAALVVAGAIAVVAPVVVANGLERGAWIVSDSSRFNLWVGLNDDSRRSFVRDIGGRELGTYLASAPDFRTRNRILGTKTADLVARRGILTVLGEQFSRQYFRLFDKDTFLTDQLPGGLIHALGSGYRRTAPEVARAVSLYAYLHYGALLLGAALGLFVFTPRHEKAWLGVILAFLAFNLLAFLLLHVKSRYRLQFVPFLDLLAGAGLASAWSRLGGNATTPVAARRLAGAIAAAILLLFLAFGGSLLPG